jgi:hypothetical protein
VRLSGTRTLTGAHPSQDLGVTVFGADKAQPRKFTLRVQASEVLLTGPPVIALTVTEVTDGVPFVHKFVLPPGPVRTFRFNGTGLSASASISLNASNASVTIVATLTDAELGVGADAFNAQQCAPVVAASGGLLYSGSGAVMMLQALLMTAPANNTTVVYAQLFDDTVAPGGGDSPLPFGCSEGLTSPGQASGLSDELAPGTIAFSNGLYIALSTTADTFTDAGGTFALRADCKVGT